MIDFRVRGFQIALPEGSVDLSTYVFTLPGDGVFRPSIVIRADRPTPPFDLTAYVVEQRRQLREQTAEFEILFEEDGIRQNHATLMTAFEWGEAQNRVRQQQLFVSVPEQGAVYAITATNLASAFDQTAPLFETILASFLPNQAQETVP